MFAMRISNKRSWNFPKYVRFKMCYLILKKPTALLMTLCLVLETITYKNLYGLHEPRDIHAYEHTLGVSFDYVACEKFVSALC